MSARRKKKNSAKSFLTIVAVLLVAILSYFTEPWRYVIETPTSQEIEGKTEAASSDLQVHYIDVGQADSILIRIPTEDGMKNILVDAGTSETSKAKDLEAYLDSVGVKELEYFIITHPDLDHVGAADEVIRDYSIQNILMADMSASIANTSSWERVLTAMEEKNLTYIPSEAGKTYSIGDATLKILGPVDPSTVKDANNYSVVFRLVYGETSFLFTGDAKFESEEEMLAAFPASEFKCDVLKVGHHGSATTSTSQEFLAAVSPSYAVISCGKDNSYGHPHAETLEKLEAAGVTVFRTDEDGTVLLCSDGSKVYRLKNQ